VNPQTNTVYISNYYDNTTSAIDGRTGTVVATVSVGSTPRYVATNPQTNTIYVINQGSNTVSVLTWSPTR
jgi:YVTN family beta-propeller protein